MVERLFLAVPWGCLRFVIVVFPDHTHLLFWPFKSCIEDIAQIFTASSLKLGQLIEDNKQTTWWNLKKKAIAFIRNIAPFSNFDIENL